MRTIYDAIIFRFTEVRYGSLKKHVTHCVYFRKYEEALEYHQQALILSQRPLDI